MIETCETFTHIQCRLGDIGFHLMLIFRYIFIHLERTPSNPGTPPILNYTLNSELTFILGAG